ncbi:MAG: tRNA (adenosine(37)-N6)-threonylcarbamoyltransferase complex ATPase subunit type 1 TsaE, partial [Candidatus Omnitrophica bacterium]|nr:tRNA (adenosine(37)-N6)-threonylcarbamoyltransferase complex ATPase subunit type 1 TsaE [Candidatus Omnitrophota bacterium]
CHFDLYRLKSLRELEDIGYEDFIGSDAICVIEWADRADGLLPKDCLKVKIKIKSQNSRLININACGDRYYNLLEDIKLIKA